MSEIWSKISVKSPVIFKLYNSFSKLSHNRQVLRQNGTESKMWRLMSSTTFVWNIFHYNKIWARYDQNSPRSHRLFSSYSIVFQNYLIIGKFYDKMSLNLKRRAWFPLQPLSETCFIIIRNERDMIKIPA
jgi:hypothetical protein